MARYLKVKVLEKRRKTAGYLEGKLNDFLKMKTAYAQIVYEDDEYVNPGSCAGSYRKAIARYDMEDLVEITVINGKVFLVNKKLSN